MPTYVVTTRIGLLDARQRTEMAAAISAAHHAATAAPAYLAQVVFDEKETSRRFLGGQVCDTHIWVRGDVRAGRTVQQRTGLIKAIMQAVARIAGVAETEVWVYLCELAPTDMIEYGHVLPQPGEERAWFESLPPKLRAHLEGVGEAKVIARDAETSDRSAICAMLGAAFQHDPAMCFIFPDPDDRRRRLPAFFAILYGGAQTHGVCCVTAGGEAATLWRAPGAGGIGLIEKLRYGLPWLHAAGFALPRAIALGDASDANHPSERHWYLHIAGCAPEVQGRGFGTAAIARGLARADADCMPAYLETGTEKNVGFYENHGFAVTHTWRVPNGPMFWSMLRPVGG